MEGVDRGRKRLPPDEDWSSCLGDSDDDGSWEDDASVGSCSASENRFSRDCRRIETATDSPVMHEIPRHRSEDLEHDRRVQDGIEVVGNVGGASFSSLDFGTREFASWQAFFSHVDEYQSRTYQRFRMRTSKTVRARNKVVKDPIEEIPESFQHYARGLECIHAGEYKSRGKGKRLRQQSCQIKCPVQISACVRRRVVANASQWVVCVTKLSLQHNHPVNEQLFSHHPRTRLAIPEEVVKTVSVLHKAGAKKKTIHQYILENCDRLPSNRDVHNLIRTLKNKQFANSSRVERLKQWMKDFSDQPGNVVSIFTDNENGKRLATCLTLQTHRMRDIFSRFSEVLLIDATHGTNESKYKIFSFMAHDIFGKGQFVQHALLRNERKETLLTAIEEFKRNNQDWPRIQCVVIDKDFTELSVLKEAFPDARILLCQFHAIKYLGEEVASATYGFSAWQKEQLRDVIHLLVYATSEREYEKHRRFLRNWDSCRDLWCSYTRQNAVTLGNNTNNRLEASWKQIKDVVNSSMGLDECAAAIMLYQTRAELYLDSLIHKITVVHHTAYDHEMTLVANLVGQHACELIYEQYDYAINRASYDQYEAFPGVIFIKNTSEEDGILDESSMEYCIRKASWQCSCLFMTTRLLPCRHVFYVRKKRNLDPVIPAKLLHQRWLLTSLRASSSSITLPDTSFRVGTVIERSGSTPWDSNRKFREAQHISNEIASNISDLGMTEFAVAMKALKRVSVKFAAKQFDQFLRGPDSRGNLPASNEDAVSCALPTDNVLVMDKDSVEIYSSTPAREANPTATPNDQSLGDDTVSKHSRVSSTTDLPMALADKRPLASGQLTTLLQLEELDGDIEIGTISRSRGRPKTKPKAKNKRQTKAFN